MKLLNQNDHEYAFIDVYLRLLLNIDQKVITQTCASHKLRLLFGH